MSGSGGGESAFFLDRDGVLTCPVWNALTCDYESPKEAGKVALIGGVVQALRTLRDQGYRLVVISNQPDVAKGKMTVPAREAVEQQFITLLTEQGIRLDGIYYCYHHPKGIVTELAAPCECRKPSPGLVRRACRELGIDAGKSWFVGDRDTDVICGRAVGCRTILVRSEESRKPGWGGSAPDFVADSLLDAVKAIGEHS